MELGIQLIDDVASDTTKLSRRLPAPMCQVGVLLMVIPDLAAVRACVKGRFRTALTVHLVEVVLVLVTVQIIEAQCVRLTATVAWHKAHTLVGQLQLRVDGRQALDGGRAPNDDLRPAERLETLLGQLDAVPLPPQVQVAVIRLFDGNPWHWRGLHAGRAVGADHF
ncbi:hypothetical protein D3C76_1346470 [compost metagenome]